MIILGVVLLILGFLIGIPILYYVGGLLLVIGLVLTVLGATGHPLGGRNTYW